MKLGEWLKKEKKTQTWLAKRMKSDQSHVSEWVNGKVMPSIATILKLGSITKGAVNFSDWVQSQGDHK